MINATGVKSSILMLLLSLNLSLLYFHFRALCITSEQLVVKTGDNPKLHRQLDFEIWVLFFLQIINETQAQHYPTQTF